MAKTSIQSRVSLDNCHLRGDPGAISFFEMSQLYTRCSLLLFRMKPVNPVGAPVVSYGAPAGEATGADVS